MQEMEENCVKCMFNNNLASHLAIKKVDNCINNNHTNSLIFLVRKIETVFVLTNQRILIFHFNFRFSFCCLRKVILFFIKN